MMKTTLIILNLLAALLVFPAMSLLHKAHIVDGMSMYVELDRAQVIDHEQLEKMFPNEAKNDRQEIARRFIGPREREWIVGYPCVFGFLMNALLIGLFMGKKRKAGEAGLAPDWRRTAPPNQALDRPLSLACSGPPDGGPQARASAGQRNVRSRR